MPKRLLIGAQPGPGWLLPDDTDLDDLHRRLRQACAVGDVAEVSIHPNDDPKVTAHLIVNGKAVAAVAVVETPAPPPPMVY